MILGTNDLVSEFVPDAKDKRIQKLENDVAVLAKTCKMLGETMQGLMQLIEIQSYLR